MKDMSANPDARIRIRFLPTEEGGRKSDVDATIYHATIEADKRYFDCRFTAINPETFKLGRWYSAYIKFLSPEIALPHFSVGKPITFWEGKTVAEGSFEEALNL